uniref:Uncharacterized protein n=1 Tax=Avena sativa TaxID=4498 RepID=A0ACD5VSB3_AVESA
MGSGFHAAVRTTQRGLQQLLAPADSGSATSSAESSGTTCQQGDISRAAKCMRQEPMLEKLPEDVLYHLHSLLLVQDAARAACVSHSFLRSWRCYPNLTLNECTLGLVGKEIKGREIQLIDIVDHILKNHSGLKTLKLNLLSCKNISDSYLDRWLHIAFHSGVKELSLVPSLYREGRYRFPCSLLSGEAAASSIQSFYLYGCACHHTETIGHLRRLKILHLTRVHITDEGLEHFLSKSVALEQLEIFQCRNIICLTIPCALKQLKILKVGWCLVLQAVEINAPKLSTFYYSGTTLLGISVGNSSRLKDVHLLYPSCILYYARTRLPSIARNVKSLNLISFGENVNTPMLPSKLPRLKKLEINLLGLKPAFSPQYDALSLVSFLEASPALDSFILCISQDAMSHDSVADDYVYLRRKPEFRHEHLRRVMITGFRASKSLVELVIYILESVPSLVRLTLDTTDGFVGTPKRNVAEALVAVEVAGRCIAGRVPAGVLFEVLGPCNSAVADASRRELQKLF